MVSITPYSNKYFQEWNDFITNSKNATFLFHRDYMDYHSDRFQDCSLMFFKEDELIALLPASVQEDVLYSHQGLTYGGLLLNSKIGTQLVLECFTQLRSYLIENKFKKLVYKVIPYIYHKLPANEDLYALFRVGAKLCRRDLSSTIEMGSRLDFSTRRKRGIKKAQKHDIICRESLDLESFHQMLSQVLSHRHAVKPTHSLAEIKLLKSRFSKTIKLFAAYSAGEMLAAVLVYEIDTVVHVQYITSSEEGRMLGALDLLFDFLIHRIYPSKKFFDFGISTEDQGMYLNEGLVSQKEEFGGRATVYDTYELIL